MVGSETRYQAFLDALGKDRLRRELTMVEGIEHSYRVEHLSVERLEKLSNIPGLPAADKKLLLQAIDFAKDRKKRGEDNKDLSTRRERLQEDLERLRGHLKALGGKNGGGPAGTQLLQRVLRAEDELRDVLDKISAAKKTELVQRKVLVKLLQKLTPAPTQN